MLYDEMNEEELRAIISQMGKRIEKLEDDKTEEKIKLKEYWYNVGYSDCLKGKPNITEQEEYINKMIIF